MIDWQPIETFPRDGNRYLVFEPFEPTCEFAWFCEEDDELRRSSRPAPFWRLPTHWAAINLPD
jgi:hypothetical protein